MIGGLVMVVLYLALMVFYIMVYWKLFVKAGKPGWACLVPIYNIIVYLEICGKPLWWIILFFVPFVNIVIALMLLYEFVKKFGKDTTFFVLTIFFSFVTMPMLAFGSAEYDPNA